MPNANNRGDLHGGPCVLCEKDCNEDSFCYGCKAVICDSCSTNFSLLGHHRPEDHKLDEDEEQDDED